MIRRRNARVRAPRSAALIALRHVAHGDRHLRDRGCHAVGIIRQTLQTDGDGLADTRVRFLTAEPVEPGRVREPILASWRRSRESKVAADRIEMPYIRDPNLDTPLIRSAEPVLRQLNEQLAGQPISIVLTDQAGLVLSRLTGDPNLARHLDTAQLAPGFSYA